MENENKLDVNQEEENKAADKLNADKPITFGNPDKYGYDKIKPSDPDKKQLEDEANAVVGSE